MTTIENIEPHRYRIGKTWAARPLPAPPNPTPLSLDMTEVKQGVSFLWHEELDGCLDPPTPSPPPSLEYC